MPVCAISIEVGMIPSVQLVATTNGVPSSTKQHIDVHSDDEFVLPITPDSSPMTVEQSSSIGSQLQPQSIIIDAEQQPQPQLQQQEQQQQLQQHTNGNYLQFNEHHLIIHEDILDAQITAHDNINYTIIDNNVIDGGDSNIVEADALTNGHNVLMQVIDVPMMFCQSMTTPSMTQLNTILSNERLPNRDELHNSNNDNDNDDGHDNDDTIDASKLISYHKSGSIDVTAAAADDATTSFNETDASNGKDSAKMDSEDGDDEEDAEEEEDEDDGGSSSEQELTNLGWLIDLKNVTNWSTDTATSSTHKRHSIGSSNLGGNTISNCIIDDIDDDDGCIGPIITDRDLSEERFKKFTIQVKQ